MRDLVHGARTAMAMMDHVSRDDAPEIVGTAPLVAGDEVRAPTTARPSGPRPLEATRA